MQWSSFFDLYVLQDHPQENEMQKSIMVFWGCLRNNLEKKRSKRQKGKETYQSECRVPKIARRDLKKAFLSDQCKDIEENNRMGKTRDLLKKIRGREGSFHAKMGQIKVTVVVSRWEDYGPTFFSFFFCLCVFPNFL